MSRRIAVVCAVTLIAVVLGCGRSVKQVVISGGRPTPYQLHVVRGIGTGAPDVVVWKNQDTVEHTVTFKLTPFEGGELRISVPANGSSRNFVVGRSAAIGDYFYGINPDFNEARPDSGPAPVVIVDE